MISFQTCVISYIIAKTYLQFRNCLAGGPENNTMKLFLSCLLLLHIVCAASSVAQEASPTPTPSGEQDVVKITTNLIQVDVTVTDRDGKVVRDLKPNEIEIYQNGK